MLLSAFSSLQAARADDDAVYSSDALRPGLALQLAQATQAACRARDFQVSVAVVDRAGAPQVTLRDQLAGNFTYDIAVLKARTAAGFRQATLNLAQSLSARSELQALNQVDQVLMVGGGVPVTYNGVVIGAVGVSGAPTPEGDHACALAGLDAIADALL
jgi:uncharacterized protein GlcG (DUF336 family)